MFAIQPLDLPKRSSRLCVVLASAALALFALIGAQGSVQAQNFAGSCDNLGLGKNNIGQTSLFAVCFDSNGNPHDTQLTLATIIGTVDGPELAFVSSGAGVLDRDCGSLELDQDGNLTAACQGEVIFGIKLTTKTQPLNLNEQIGNNEGCLEAPALGASCE